MQYGAAQVTEYSAMLAIRARAGLTRGVIATSRWRGCGSQSPGPNWAVLLVVCARLRATFALRQWDGLIVVPTTAAPRYCTRLGTLGWDSCVGEESRQAAMPPQHAFDLPT